MRAADFGLTTAWGAFPVGVSMISFSCVPAQELHSLNPRIHLIDEITVELQQFASLQSGSLSRGN
jgi:hypothetical protein